MRGKKIWKNSFNVGTPTLTFLTWATPSSQPRMTSWCPILNLNGFPRDLDESKTFPSARVPVEGSPERERSRGFTGCVWVTALSSSETLLARNLLQDHLQFQWTLNCAYWGTLARICRSLNKLQAKLIEIFLVCSQEVHHGNLTPLFLSLTGGWNE